MIVYKEYEIIDSGIKLRDFLLKYNSNSINEYINILDSEKDSSMRWQEIYEYLNYSRDMEIDIIHAHDLILKFLNNRYIQSYYK